jgi:hypothetical protein
MVVDIRGRMTRSSCSVKTREHSKYERDRGQAALTFMHPKSHRWRLMLQSSSSEFALRLMEDETAFNTAGTLFLSFGPCCYYRRAYVI